MDFIIHWGLPGLVLGGIGVILFFNNHTRLQKARKIAAWPTTVGLVERSSVERVRVNRPTRTGRPGHTRIGYLPCIEYTYKVFGTPFRANGFELSDRATPNLNQAAAARYAAEYPPAKTVTLFYNPDQPEEAYLRIKDSTARLERTRYITLGLIALGCLWVAAGAVIRIIGSTGADSRAQAAQVSSANLPIATSAISTGLGTILPDIDLVCTESGAAGDVLAYTLYDCRSGLDGEVFAIQVYHRVDAPEKTDLVSALAPTGNPTATADLFARMVEITLSEPERQSALDWLKLNLPGILVSGGSEDGKIASLPVSLESLGDAIRFNLGKLK